MFADSPPPVGVLVATFDREDYPKVTTVSALSQRFADADVVVVDKESAVGPAAMAAAGRALDRPAQQRLGTK